MKYIHEIGNVTIEKTMEIKPNLRRDEYFAEVGLTFGQIETRILNTIIKYITPDYLYQSLKTSYIQNIARCIQYRVDITERPVPWKHGGNESANLLESCVVFYDVYEAAPNIVLPYQDIIKRVGRDFMNEEFVVDEVMNMFEEQLHKKWGTWQRIEDQLCEPYRSAMDGTTAMMLEFGFGEKDDSPEYIEYIRHEGEKLKQLDEKKRAMYKEQQAKSCVRENEIQQAYRDEIEIHGIQDGRYHGIMYSNNMVHNLLMDKWYKVPEDDKDSYYKNFPPRHYAYAPNEQPVYGQEQPKKIFDPHTASEASEQSEQPKKQGFFRRRGR